MTADESIPPLPPAGHAMALSCAGICPDHGDIVVPLGTCWYCGVSVTDHDPWDWMDAIRNGLVVLDHVTGRPITVDDVKTRKLDRLDFPHDPPPMPEGWRGLYAHHLAMAVETQVHARCHEAWAQRPVSMYWCPECSHELPHQGPPFPPWCPECEAPLDEAQILDDTASLFGSDDDESDADETDADETDDEEEDR